MVNSCSDNDESTKPALEISIAEECRETMVNEGIRLAAAGFDAKMGGRRQLGSVHALRSAIISADGLR